MPVPLLGLLALLTTQAQADQPVETGKVEWMRDFPAALNASAESGKPVFALFQEVPGCAGCQKFGMEVLSDELLVEAIESEFVPVVVYNNQSGADAEILKMYREPAWNYQVVRFLNASGQDIIPRKDGIWTKGPLAGRMAKTLRRQGKAVPGYLQAQALPGDGTELQVAAFAMYCFWTGEMELGAIDGVVTTEAGWLEGQEVTRVIYRKDLIEFPALVKAAAEVKCANKVYASEEQLGTLGQTRLLTGPLTESYRSARQSDQKRQLQGTAFSRLKLHPVQATRVNAWARRDLAKALEWLSPSQLEQLR